MTESDACDDGTARTDLSAYSAQGFERGASRLVELGWMVASALLFRHSLAIGSRLKAWVLRRFGATVGTGLVIKPSVHVKFPWKLRVGSHVWIGEGAWIDNIDIVTLGDNVCISQGAFLVCGNHDYSTTTFDLVTKPIVVEDGAWLGAKSIVGPGVTVGSHAVLTAGSVAVRDLEPYMIHQGNPATAKTKRGIRPAAR